MWNLNTASRSEFNVLSNGAICFPVRSVVLYAENGAYRYASIVSVNGFIQFPVHHIHKTYSENKCTIGKSMEFWSKKQHYDFAFSFICMRLLLLKSLGIHSSRIHICIIETRIHTPDWLVDIAIYWMPIHAVTYLHTCPSAWLSKRRRIYWDSSSNSCHIDLFGWVRPRL